MKAGTVAVIGRANAGKSTLVNVLVGEKVSIVSPKPQTTRDRILGVLTTNEYQIVFADTPGIYNASGALNAFMQRTTNTTAKDVDLVLFVIDGHEGIKAGDMELLKKYSASDVPFVAVMTKTDIMPENEIPLELTKFSEIGVEVVPVSARKNKNLKELIKVILSKLPDGDKVFEQDIISDRSERFMISEIMREKILLKFDKEIPHGIAIVVNTFEKRATGNLYDVNLDIICEKPAHKAILIGKAGKAIKEVSAFARADMEKFLDAKVFLTTYVKVKEDWRGSESLIKEYGYYTDGE
ncbi:MAG: GTPase Era [Clostridia bacterium]|nr:GTPase Era [Clostridia bacterium]